MNAHVGDLEVFKEQFGLGYQLDFLKLINGVTPLAGKRVLEIGGSNLPREVVLGALGAKQWICIDNLGGYHGRDVRQDEPRLVDHYVQTKAFMHGDPAEAILAEDYAIVDGDAADLQLENHFDVAISICAFEHVQRFAAMLDRVHAALVPEGQLLSLFQPIWPSAQGHHLAGAKDAAGNVFHYWSGIVPPWAHLLQKPPQLYKYLCTVTDERCAADIVHEVYNSTQVNRMFYEDYADYLEGSKFRGKHIQGVGDKAAPDDVAALLRAAHPGRTHFGADTVFMQAMK